MHLIPNMYLPIYSRINGSLCSSQGSGNQYNGIVDCVQTIVREEGPSALLKVKILHPFSLSYPY